MTDHQLSGGDPGIHPATDRLAPDRPTPRDPRLDGSCGTPGHPACVHPDVNASAGGELLSTGDQITNDDGFAHAGTGLTGSRARGPGSWWSRGWCGSGAGRTAATTYGGRTWHFGYDKERYVDDEPEAVAPDSAQAGAHLIS